MPEIRPRVIFFHMDGTLFDHAHSRRHALSAVRDIFPALAEKTVEELMELYNASLQQTYDEYLAKMITYEEADSRKIHLFFASLDLPAPGLEQGQQFINAYWTVYRANRRPTLGSIEVLVRLRENGYSIGIITDGGVQEQREKAEAIGVLHLTDRIITSEQAGYRKPDRRIFEYAIAQLGMNSFEDTYVVGNCGDPDIESALNVRLTTILYSPTAEVSQRLVFGRPITVIKHMHQLLVHLNIRSPRFMPRFIATTGQLVVLGIGVDIVTEPQRCLHISKGVVQLLVNRMGAVLACLAHKRLPQAVAHMENLIRAITHAAEPNDERITQSSAGRGLRVLTTSTHQCQMFEGDYSTRVEFHYIMTTTEYGYGVDGPQPEETLPSPSRPGILTVILREGAGLSVPDGFEESPDEERNKRNIIYAILTFDKSQKKAISHRRTRQNPIWTLDTGSLYRPLHWDVTLGRLRESNWNFDACRPAELAIYLYLGDPYESSSIQDHAFLGVARIAIEPSQIVAAASQWIDIQHGTGRLRVSLEYKDMKDRALKASDFQHRHVNQLLNTDTWQLYTKRTVPTVQRLQNVNHPFIAPLTLTFQSQEDANRVINADSSVEQGLTLLSPAIDGGNLFHHLQKQQRFNLESAQFYAAEILCALEYLHEVRGIYSWLKPRHVLLDCFGHIVLYGSGLYKEAVDGARSYGMPEYPSPEVLLNKGHFRAADWWTLGIFLYEMLTGLPLFFDEDTEEIRLKILGTEPIQVSKELPPNARDIITRLLEREPDHRLGAKGGASEIKKHPFFAGIDWSKLLRRDYEPPFKPDFTFRYFEQHGVQEHPQPDLPQEIEGSTFFTGDTFYRDHEPEHNLDFDSDDDAVLTPVSSQEGSGQEINDDNDDGWELVWEEGAPGELYFRHRITGDKKSVPARDVNPSKKKKKNDDDDTTVAELRNGGPSISQKQDVLEAALKAGHDRIVSQIISHGIDLNVRLFGYKFESPLGWAIDHKKLDLVRLMLDNGADIRFLDREFERQDGPALTRAVATRDRKLIELLLQRRPGRVDLTRALGRAVDQRDRALAQLLLANGARCDFEEEDRPLPFNHGADDGCCFDVVSLEEEFIPPLVRAVKMGDVSLVRLLLRHGADANVGYHGLHASLMLKHIKFGCGRVIQLAMELKRHAAVKLLLAAGADIGLAQPVWHVPGHRCWGVTRVFYQTTMSRLRTAVELAKKT
ncbi:hypothetical protein MKX08_001323 [Trichoderma sp. CBMAI-0020]|nr:hypothetical protein MKX08_001323 [Trichoderma sp. CBMAI-0020]